MVPIDVNMISLREIKMLYKTFCFQAQQATGITVNFKYERDGITNRIRSNALPDNNFHLYLEDFPFLE